MQGNSFKLHAADNAALKKFILLHNLERILPMTKRFTRKQQLENLKLQYREDLLRSFVIAFNRYDDTNEQSVWEYNAVKQTMLDRMNY